MMGLAIIFLVIIFALTLKIGYIQLFKNKTFTQEAMEQRMRTLAYTDNRGNILSLIHI